MQSYYYITITNLSSKYLLNSKHNRQGPYSHGAHILGVGEVGERGL